MSVSIRGGTSNALAEVDSGSLAQRTSLRPMRSLAWNSLAAQSGGLTTIAAGGRIFSLRNTSTNLILIRRVGLGFVMTTAFGAAQIMEWGLAFGRSFTVSDTVGTDVSPTVNVGKHRTSLATPNIAARIGIAAVVSGGTVTPDALYLGMTASWAPAAIGNLVAPTLNNLHDHTADDLPIVLAANEGIVIQNITTMGATGVGRAYVNLEYAEVAPADYA